MKDEAFSSIDLVGQCLIDEPRTLSFKRAIEKSIKRGDTVLDAGTGSGIMALFAAKTKAKKVIALEFDNYIAGVAKNNFKQNKLENKISILRGDARKFKFSKQLHFDVVVMEMLTSGLVEEFQVQASNNLHKQGVVDSNTVFIPKLQETYISLIEAQFNIYGLNMRMVKHLWNNLSKNQKVKFLSQKYLINSVDFSKINKEDCSITLSIKILNSGNLNSVYLSSLCYLTDKIKVKDTETLNSPVVIPLKKDIKVKKGDNVKLKIKYKYGHGYNNFFINII